MKAEQVLQFATKRPWKIAKTSLGTWKIVYGQRYIADIVPTDSPEAKANAEFIVMAVNAWDGQTMKSTSKEAVCGK